MAEISKDFNSVEEAVQFLNEAYPNPQNNQKVAEAFKTIFLWLTEKAVREADKFLIEHYGTYNAAFFRVLCERTGLDFEKTSAMLIKQIDEYYKIEKGVNEIFKDQNKEGNKS